MKTILDPNFRYVPSVATDLRKTFARIRREQQSQKQLSTPRSLSDARENVVTLNAQKTGAKRIGT
jgi:hypothetical protein